MTNQWQNDPDIVAEYVRRPGRTVSVKANEVFLLQKDGQLMDIVTEGRRPIRSLMGWLASKLGLGFKFDGYLARGRYWKVRDPSTIEAVYKRISKYF